jgi:hypothetical protein
MLAFALIVVNNYTIFPYLSLFAAKVATFIFPVGLVESIKDWRWKLRRGTQRRKDRHHDEERGR